MTQPISTNKGTYVLIMRCRKTGKTTIGKLGQIELKPGFYIYVGSARGPGGIKARVTRHRRQKKKLHWHIDYLRRHTALIETWILAGDTNREHDWAKVLSSQYKIAHVRFGSSDCRCATHLFYSGVRPSPNHIQKMVHETDGQLEVEIF